MKDRFKKLFFKQFIVAVIFSITLLAFNYSNNTTLSSYSKSYGKAIRYNINLKPYLDEGINFIKEKLFKDKSASVIIK